ncbi:uncharacterized protein LOC110715021 [Chenopodium quinoa]|uniref:uncharacterized protein LOC110715021 n=1 Tax=Chenopodium quinoa TaxID=63459 RepID=UPI000B781F7F|nr:uncharacterized protein LOC110715021 [Chenopodium quinoa]
MWMSLEERARITICKCKVKNECRFRIYCAKLKDEETWKIKSLELKHICSHQIHNSKLSSQYLAERYLEDWRDDPCMRLSAFRNRARREIGVEINYYIAYYSRDKAMKMIYGDAKAEYSRVWDYAATIIKYNPGSTAKVKIAGIDTPKPVFHRLYICLQACKEGFVAGCRSIPGVDGAHLRGPYPGILLTAAGKDGNQNIFPVAWAIVETENSETWTWFLSLLKEDLRSVASSVTWVHEKEDPTYMSDRQKAKLYSFCYVVG